MTGGGAGGAATDGHGEVGLEERVWEALATVLDPELDQPITDLGFVRSATVDGGEVIVRLRLPTFFCAPNFVWMMVADARDAIRGLPGVAVADVAVDDHFASEEINAGVAASVGFGDSFDGEPAGELDELRRTFAAKAYAAALERVCRGMRSAGTPLEALGALRLGAVPTGYDRERLERRRADLGLPLGPEDPLVVDASGAPIPVPELSAWLRKAQTVRVNMEGNGELCRGLLHTRYRLGELAGSGGSSA